MATRLELRTRARIRADQDNSTFPDDVAYNYYLDEAGREVWYDLLAAGWPLDFSSTTITATGATTYQIAGSGTVMAVRAVWFLQAGQFYELKRLNPGKEAQLRSLASAGNYAAFYEIRQSNSLGAVVELFPAQAAGSYRVDYIPDFAGFSTDGDVWHGPPRSDELIVLKAAVKGTRKEGDPNNLAEALLSEYKELFTKVSAMASWADMRNPAMIRDVMSSQSSPRSTFDYPVAGPGFEY